MEPGLNDSLANNTDPCSEESTGDHHLGLHIASAFVLLIVSAVGVFVPVLLQRGGKAVHKAHIVLVVGKFFGGGVLVGTAFIHILAESVSNLTNPCLPEFFTKTYPSFVYLVTMLAALALHFFEWSAMTFNEKDEKPPTPHDVQVGQDEKSSSDEQVASSSSQTSSRSRSPSDAHEHVHSHEHGHGHGHGHVHARRSASEISEQAELKAKISAILLEAAVAVHSVVIGIALGVATDAFVSLWIALSFHQFFEGIGIGFRIAEVKTISNLTTYLSALVFTVATPIGIAIGIVIAVSHTLVGTEALIIQGVLGAIAAGLLIYSALVSVTAEEFGTISFLKMKKSRRIIAFLSFYLGAIAMAIIGIWA